MRVIQKTITIFCDRSSVIHLCKNSTYHEKIKHIDVKLRFIRNKVLKGVVRVVKIYKDENPADTLTKVVPVAKFKLSLDLTGLSNF